MEKTMRSGMDRIADSLKNMKIKRKMVISNVLLIIIPVLIAAALLGIFFNGPGTSYWEIMENVFDDHNDIYSAQTLLSSCKHKSRLDETAQEMKNSGYHFSVERDGKVWYSNLSKDDVSIVDDAAGKMDSASNFTVSTGDTVVIREQFRDDGHDYSSLAVRTPASAKAASSSGEPYIKRYFEYFIVLMVVILLAVVIALNFIMSRWIQKSILSPLGDLSEGSERIRNGDLDFDMRSPRKDEIGTVINDFDEMRRHLQESVRERLLNEQYRRELIAGISHDLRTPLTTIRGYLEGLHDGIADTPEKREKYYRAIELSISNLEHITSDLTDLSRLESSADRFDTETVELNAFYRSEIKAMNEKHLNDNVNIRLIESGEPLYASIDVGEMQRVHANLIGNTIKYRERDASNVIITLSKKGREAAIRIADDGPGVKDGDLENVFECFFRGDPSRVNPRDGSGVGLAVVREIVKGLGGTVFTENDSGFAVEIHLPLKEQKDEEKDTDSRRR